MLNIHNLVGCFFSLTTNPVPYLAVPAVTRYKNIGSPPLPEMLINVLNEVALNIGSAEYSSEYSEIASAINKDIKGIRRKIELDIDLAYREDPAAISREYICLTYPFVYALSLHRLAHQLYVLGARSLARIIAEEAHSKTAIDIHPGASIEAPTFMDHGTGIVIGETVEISKNVSIYHGVTLGALSFQKDESGVVIKGQKRHPTIKENVTLYSGCVILGGNTVIGKNSKIGANTWVTKSVPPDTLVSFNPDSMELKRG